MMTPENWTTIELKRLGMQRTETITPLDYPDTEFELWSVPSFPSGGPEYAKGIDIGSTKQKVQEGDVLLCKINPRINRVWVVGPDIGKPQIASTEWIVFRASGIEPEFLMYRFREEHFRELLCANVSGVGGSLTRARPQIVKNYKIAIAPHNEQKRIVEKINSLQIHSQAANGALTVIPLLLEKFRQSVWSSAFRGDLTADWRAQNPDIEPAEKLLERIRKERRKRWEEDELAKMKARGKEPKDDKWKAKYKEPEPVDTTELPELPEGWCWACFDEIASVDSKLVDPRTTPDLPHIAPNHIETLTGRLLEYKTVLEDGVTSPKHLFHSGQILYSKIRPYLAKAVVVDFEGVCSADMYPISTILKKVYLHNWLISPAFTDFAILKQGRTVLPKINQKDLGTLPVPVAPLEEQNQIANKLLSCTNIRDEIAKKVATALVDIQKLDQSILSKAFQGELVPQDPNDEPASEFLKRIKKERESMVAQGKTQKKRIVKKTPVKTSGKTNALETLILREYPQDEFTFDDLSNKIAMQYDELKKAIFLLLEEGAELTHGKKLAMFFDNHTEGMHFKVRKS